jgi:ATP-dependent helicase/nuclease subunit A
LPTIEGKPWRELRQRAASDVFQRAHDAPAELLRIADFTTPSRFLETILTGPMQGRASLFTAEMARATRSMSDQQHAELERNETASSTGSSPGFVGTVRP